MNPRQLEKGTGANREGKEDAEMLMAHEQLSLTFSSHW